MLYHNIGTGTSTAGQAVAGSDFQLNCPTWCCLCVLGPRLNSGRLAVVVVVKLQVIDVHCSVATVSGSTRGFPDCQFPHIFYTIA